MKHRRFSLKAFIVSLGGLLVLAFGASGLVYAQTPQQQINNGLCSGANFDVTSNTAGACASTNSATDSINSLVHTIINILSVIVGVVAVVMIIVGGLRYVTSGGNDTSVTGAKNTILYAVIGLVIVALSQILVRFILDKVTNT